MTHTTAARNLLDIPNEILIDIILYLNARERVALGNSCHRLNSLVFEDKKSLGDLDFSADGGYLTSMSELQQYFNNKTKYNHIRRINVNGVYCTRPAQMLAYISKAKNLVEVNITGIKFKNYMNFLNFLKPLVQLKKFSGDWPTDLEPDLLELFKEPFNRLTHLSMTLNDTVDKVVLVSALELCQNVEELHILQMIPCCLTRHIWNKTPKRMKKLRLATYYGRDTNLLDAVIMDLLSDPEQWTKFESFDTKNERYFHCEKNVSVSKELREDVRAEIISQHDEVAVGWSLCLQSLLEDVIRISRHTDLNNLGCLDEYKYPKMCLLRIKDTTLLLKDPRQQISYLNVVHDITPECDIHLVALTFPSLTKLVLSRITKKDAPLRSETTHRRSGFKGKRVAFEKQNETQDPHPSFKKLVENTPQLRDLTVYDGKRVGQDTWDLMALQLISGWKNLTTLYLANLPIKSGQFLIEIGIQCVNLEKLRLENLGARGCYRNALLNMLGHCHNLKDFSIEQTNIGQVSHIFTTLSKNPKLRRVRVKILGMGNDIVSNIIPSIVKLIRSTMLILFVYEVEEGMTLVAYNELKSVLQRLKIDLDRPNFQFAISGYYYRDTSISHQFSHLDLVHKDLLLPHLFIDTLFRLNL